MKKVIPIILLLAIGIIALFVYLNMDNEQVTITEDDKGQRIKSVKPQKRVERVMAEVKSNEVKKAREKWLGVEVDHREVKTNGTMVIETIYTVDGKEHLRYSSTQKAVFENTTDQVIALATADVPNGNMPPLPAMNNFDREFVKSLQTKIVIHEDDSEEVKEAKQRVIEVREALLKALKEGLSPEEVLKENRRIQEDQAAIRMDVVKGLRKYIDKGDMEGAKIYVEKMNEALAEMGIMKIELPRPREEVRAERLERSLKNKEAK